MGKMTRISQTRLAKDLGVSQGLVSMVLNGRRENISPETYQRIWDHAFNREGSAHARDILDDLRLIDELLLIRTLGDAVVDLVHLGSPCLAIGEYGVLQLLGPCLFNIERHLPVLPADAVRGHAALADLGLLGNALGRRLHLLGRRRLLACAQPPPRRRRR